MDAPKAEEHTLEDTSKDTLEDTSKAMSVTPFTRLHDGSTILGPHDGSTRADIALKHAIYLSNISGAEITILNEVEDIDSVDSSAVLVTSRERNETRNNYEIKLEGEVKSMVEEKIRLCKQVGLKVKYHIKHKLVSHPKK